MTQRIRQAFLLPLLVITSLISACGFQLRGNMDVASEISQLAVSGSDSGYVRDLSRALRNAGIQMNSAAAYRLRILDVNRHTGRETAASAGRYDRLLTFKVTYQLETSDGLKLFAPVELSNERYISQDKNRTNAGQAEVNITFNELRQDMISTTVRRIAGLSGSRLQQEVARARKVRQMELEQTAGEELQ